MPVPPLPTRPLDSLSSQHTFKSDPELALHQEGYERIWGQPNLRITDHVPHLAAAFAAFEATISAEDQSDGDSNQDPLLVREEYLAVTTLLEREEQYASVGMSRGCGFFYIGTPGTGKSTFLIYRALLLAEQLQPFLLVTTRNPTTGLMYTHEGVNRISLFPSWYCHYRFDEYPSRFQILIDSAPEIATPPPAYLLCIRNTTTVVALSPRAERYKPVLKVEGSRFCTSWPWSEEEARAYLYLHQQLATNKLSQSPSSLLSLLEKHRNNPLSTRLILPPSAAAASPDECLPEYAGIPGAYGVVALFHAFGGAPSRFGSLLLRLNPDGKGDPFMDVPLFRRPLELVQTAQHFRMILEGKDVEGAGQQMDEFRPVVFLRPSSTFPRVSRSGPEWETYIPTKYLRALLQASFRSLTTSARTELAQAVLPL